MYYVYFDGVKACTPGTDTDFINPVLQMEEGKAGSFTFAMPPTHPYRDMIVEHVTCITVYIGDRETLRYAEPRWKGFASSLSEDFHKNVKVECYGVLATLAQTYQRQHLYQAYTPENLLRAYIANHNNDIQDPNKRFTVGNVTVRDSNNAITCYTNYNTTLEEINADLIDDLGGFLRVRFEEGVNYLDLLAESPRESGQRVEFSKNLLDLSINYDTDDLCTALIPIGAIIEEDQRTSAAVDGLDEYVTIKSQTSNGVDYVYSADAVKNYGWKWKVVKWDDVTTPAALFTKANQYVSDYQYRNLVIEATALDLSITSADFDKFELSDMVPAISKPHGMDTKLRITKIVNYLNQPANDRVTLGANKRIKVSEVISRNVSTALPKPSNSSALPTLRGARVYSENGFYSEGHSTVIGDQNSYASPISSSSPVAVTNSYATIYRITVPAGTWVIGCTAIFSAPTSGTAAGVVEMYLSDTGAGNAIQGSNDIIAHPTNFTSGFSLAFNCVYKTTAASTMLYICARSTNQRNVNGLWWRTTRIS